MYMLRLRSIHTQFINKQITLSKQIKFCWHISQLRLSLTEHLHLQIGLSKKYEEYC